VILARCNCRARDGVVVEVIVNVNSVSRISVFESPRDSNFGTEIFGSATGDGDLCAFDVELGDSRRPWVVDSKLLDAKEIVSVSNASGEVECIGLFQVPSSSRENRTDIQNLKPHVTGTIEVCSSAWSFGHIYGERTIVVDCNIGGESYGRTGFHRDGLGVVSTGSNIAAKVVGGEVSDGTVVVGVLADIFVSGVLDAVGGQGLENVMARCLTDQGREAYGNSSESHVEYTKRPEKNHGENRS